MQRVIAGFLRFCIGSRCRVGDATRIAQEPTIDLNHKTGRGYIDVTAHITKRSQVRLETSRMGVEITSHTWGLCQDDWAQQWLEARREAGLDAVTDGTLMPSVGPDGFIPEVRMQTDEAAIHLREILIEWGIPIEEAALYTSHSLKATTLSWCAKMGVPFKARRMLGYHAKSSEKSTLCYSRDAMAWPLRHLGKALQLIADGFSDPDTTRSGTWAQQDDSTAADAFGAAIKRVAKEVAEDDPVRYTGATIIGQAFEQQWLELDHNKTALQTAQFVTGGSSGTEPEEDTDGGIITPVSHPRPKRARRDPYEPMTTSTAIGPCPDGQEERSSNQGAELTPLDEDAFPLEVAVDSVSEESPSEASDTDAETLHLEDSAFVRLLHDKMSRAEWKTMPNNWDSGLSPEPLYSFYHTKTRCRHWSFEPRKPISFLCSVAPNLNYKKGGELHMDISKGVCKNCISKAEACSKWAQYLASLHQDCKPSGSSAI